MEYLLRAEFKIMSAEIKGFGVGVLIALVGHGLFWTGYFVSLSPLWIIYAVFSVFSFIVMGALLLSVLGD